MTVPLYRQGLLGVFEEKLAITIGRTRRQSPSRSGPGSTHAAANSCGALDGGKNYKLQLLPNIPVKEFWSVIVYSNQTGRCCRPIRSIRAWVAKPRAC
jgi:Protein of unknown function (DUF1214)